MEAIQRLLYPLRIRVVYRPASTLRKQLVRVKDLVPPLKQANVVYCIPCKTCSKVYVGQNSRLLETRLSNHKAAVKHVKIDVSAVAEHVWKLGHQVDFQSTSILDHENNQFRRYALESWHIQRHNSFNGEGGPLLPVYRCLR